MKALKFCNRAAPISTPNPNLNLRIIFLMSLFSTPQLIIMRIVEMFRRRNIQGAKIHGRHISSVISNHWAERQLVDKIAIIQNFLISKRSRPIFGRIFMFMTLVGMIRSRGPGMGGFGIGGLVRLAGIWV